MNMTECRFDIRILSDYLTNGSTYCYYNAPDYRDIIETKIYQPDCEIDSNALYIIEDFSEIHIHDNKLKNILYITQKSMDTFDHSPYKMNVIIYVSGDTKEEILQLTSSIHCKNFLSYLHNRLLDLSIKNDATVFLNQVSHLLGNPIVVHDTSFRILYESSNLDRISSFADSGFQKTEYLSNYTIDFIKKEISYNPKCPEPIIIDRKSIHKRLIHCPIYSDNVLIAIVNVLELDTFFSDDTLELTNLFSKYFGLLIKDNKRFLYSMGILHEQFFKDLLAESTTANHFLTKRAADLGLTIGKYNYLGIIMHNGRPLSNSKVSSIASDLSTILNIKLCTSYKNQILVLLSHDNPEVLTKTQYENLYSFLKMSNLSIVFSHSFQAIEECRIHYLQSSNLLRIISNDHISNKRIFRFDDYLVTQLLMYAEQNIPKNEVISPALQFYIEYDQQYNTEFLPTIKAYINNLMHINNTATALNIHKNTLFYRLKKINEIYPIDFSDHETIFKLMLSLRVLDIINKPK